MAMQPMEFLSSLICPVTGNDLEPVAKSDFPRYQIPETMGQFNQLVSGLIDSSHSYFYPIFEDILVLYAPYALYIGSGTDERAGISFDKKRVFDYYNEVNYQLKDSMQLFGDTQKWVDFRPVSADYIRNSLRRAGQFLPDSGTYLLDIASGPIGLPEYLELSSPFEYRICVDVSINALLQAKHNLESVGKKGLYICGDITNIPIRSNSCDAVLSQHTVYHLPKNDQARAVEELYRVAQPQGKIVIIYSWFYHSWFMNLSLNVVQLYRILRHLAGKIYVRLFASKPRLYFYPHSPGWFKRTFSFSDEMEFHAWRSVNKFFLDIFIHRFLFGKQLLARLTRLEDRYSNFMSRFGEYAAIVITKNKK